MKIVESWNVKLVGALAALVLSPAPCARAMQVVEQAEITLAIDADFPGGNIQVERVTGNVVDLHQDLRDTAGDWFYWYFRVRGAAGRTLTFHFTQSNVIGVRGPAVSRDQGMTWQWLGTSSVTGTSFTYEFPAQAAEIRFAFGIPYVQEDLRKFLARHQPDSALRIESLCESAQGRQVEMLHVGQLQREPDHRVLLTARHHACEALASYVLEGLLETVLADESAGAWLREHVEFLVVPFVDKDGVEAGDQGKNRRPHDHNRDYRQRIYPSVKALTNLVPAWSGGKLRVALDLHCPHIRGPQNEVVYCVGGPNAENWRQIMQFGRTLESVQAGPLKYRAEDNLPFGKSWNTGSGHPSLQSFSAWAVELPGVKLATTIETPYANVSGTEVTADAARSFGRDLAHALRSYLER
jgi:hypothetical protein